MIVLKFSNKFQRYADFTLKPPKMRIFYSQCAESLNLKKGIYHVKLKWSTNKYLNSKIEKRLGYKSITEPKQGFSFLKEFFLKKFTKCLTKPHQQILKKPK